MPLYLQFCYTRLTLSALLTNKNQNDILKSPYSYLSITLAYLLNYIKVGEVHTHSKPCQWRHIPTDFLLENSKVVLHVFVDASTKVFAATLYAPILNQPNADSRNESNVSARGKIMITMQLLQ
jgi:hypothetical protein